MRSLVPAGTCVLFLAFTATAGAELITNGGFEAGGSGWDFSSSAGSGGSFFVTNALFSPLTGNPTVGPAGGSFYAVSDQFGPGTNAVSQEFTAVAHVNPELLSYDMFVNNWGPDFSSAANQIATVELLAGSSDPLTGPALAVFPVTGNVFPIHGNPNPYVHYSFDISALLTPGQTYRIAFIETDSEANLNQGVDNVSIQETPEPGTAWLLMLFLPVISLICRQPEAMKP